MASNHSTTHPEIEKLMKKVITPKITLVGAGPGDPELLTIKGFKALHQAKVILYDALVNEQLLQSFQDKELIFVGKRKGMQSLSQEEINQLMVQKALKCGAVVRLKGGDPFVFGRGFEEWQYAAAFAIPVEVIPGVSSAISGPAFAGIPITHRGVATSFTVLTATCTQGESNPMIEKIPLLDGTVVILMGLACLDKIAQSFISKGLPHHPFAVVSNASLPHQQMAIGTAGTIVERVKIMQIKAPAIIVLGEAVKLKNSVILEDKSFVLN